jgi:hypothetical protein
MKANQPLPFPQQPDPAAAFRPLDRRSFLQRSLSLAGGCAFCPSATGLLAASVSSPVTTLISPGCRRSKVKVA